MRLLPHWDMMVVVEENDERTVCVRFCAENTWQTCIYSFVTRSPRFAMSCSVSPSTFEGICFCNPNIIPGQDNAIGDIVDAEGKPYYLHLKKNACETVHTAGNRAYCDIELDEAASTVLHILDKVSINTVHERSPEWFGEEIPVDVVEQFYRSCVSKRRGREGTFLRAKVGFQKQAAIIKVIEDYEEDEEDEEFAEENVAELGDGAVEVSTLEAYAGKHVEFVVQLRTIRFLKQTFCLEFVLHHVRVPRVASTPLNLAQMIIQTHETAEKRRLYEQKREELLSLEKLKREVEVEMENVLERQKKILHNYNTVLAEEEKLRDGADWIPATREKEDDAAVSTSTQCAETEETGGEGCAEGTDTAAECADAVAECADAVAEYAGEAANAGAGSIESHSVDEKGEEECNNNNTVSEVSAA